MDIKNIYGKLLFSDDFIMVSETLKNAARFKAYLRGAYLRGAYLRGAYLRGADLPHFSIVPEKGCFTAFKKTSKGVIEILVPEDAKRVSSIVGRKCRASHIIVISGDGTGGKSPIYGDLVYNIGDTIYADGFNEDIRTECTNGIHFFMTYKEAEGYVG